MQFTTPYNVLVVLSSDSLLEILLWLLAKARKKPIRKLSMKLSSTDALSRTGDDDVNKGRAFFGFSTSPGESYNSFSRLFVQLHAESMDTASVLCAFS